MPTNYNAQDNYNAALNYNGESYLGSQENVFLAGMPSQMVPAKVPADEPYQKPRKPRGWRR